MASATRETFLTAINGQWKPKVESISIPELGSDVFVRGLTVGEFDAVRRYSAQVADGKVPGYGWRALTMAKGLCDEHGVRMFNDADANQLSQMPNDVAEKIVDAIDRLSASTKQEQEAIAKN